MSDRERMRRYRRRMAEGLAVFVLELDEVALADRLVAHGLLSPLSADSRDAIRATLLKLVNSYIERGQLRVDE
jgi:hypothetical protein